MKTISRPVQRMDLTLRQGAEKPGSPAAAWWQEVMPKQGFLVLRSPPNAWRSLQITKLIQAKCFEGVQ